ncbi:MAG: hypothetical protein EU541_02865 [Promethearchaeota archaeon]|nr:MAG: hypothetical protein EU541_02865 [Candidatus Lokiarchaeota archaeon]
MNFNENDMFGAALIGFDMIDGPFLKWEKQFDKNADFINIDDFALNFYLSFRAGNTEKTPRAIVYDNFSIFAFPRNLELCCLFMKPKGIKTNIERLNKIANRIIVDMEDDEDDKKEITEDSNENTREEIKRLIINLLNDTEMSTPELRRYFKLNNSEIWQLMSDLEDSQKIKRTRKKGRAQLWTAK